MLVGSVSRGATLSQSGPGGATVSNGAVGRSKTEMRSEGERGSRAQRSESVGCPSRTASSLQNILSMSAIGGGDRSGWVPAAL